MESRPPSYTSRAGFTRIPQEATPSEDKDTSYPPPAARGAVRRGWSTSVRQLSYDYRAVLRAAPAALASALWIAMMVYFFVYFTTVLNQVDGHFPRIGLAYSVWPYISCIGAVRLSAFQIFACVIAPLVITAFGLDLWFGRFIAPGRWLRITKVGLAAASSSFLIALSFESVNGGNHLHLIFTSIQSWCMATAKVVDDILNHTRRRYDPTNEHLLVAKRWKRAAGFVAMYLYHAEEIRDSIISKTGKGSSFRVLPKLRLSRAQERESDTVPLNQIESGSRPLSRSSFHEAMSFATADDPATFREDGRAVSSSLERGKIQASSSR